MIWLSVVFVAMMLQFMTPKRSSMTSEHVVGSIYVSPLLTLARLRAPLRAFLSEGLILERRLKQVIVGAKHADAAARVMIGPTIG